MIDDNLQNQPRYNHNDAYRLLARLKSKQVGKDVKWFLGQLDEFEKESRKVKLIVK